MRCPLLPCCCCFFCGCGCGCGCGCSSHADVVVAANVAANVVVVIFAAVMAVNVVVLLGSFPGLARFFNCFLYHFCSGINLASIW